MLLVHFFPRFASETAAQVQEHPLASFGHGSLTLFVAPVAGLIVALTIVGLPLPLLAGVVIFVTLYLGWLFVGLAAGDC